MSKSVERRISEEYERLSPSEKKLAQVVLECGGDLASYSAAELCEMAGVSKAAATRFFRELGYSGFKQARVQARKDRQWGSPLTELLDTEEAPGGIKNGLGSQLQADLQNLTRTFQGIDPAALETGADLLAGAEKIWVIGFRNSYALAYYARGLLIQVKADVHLLPVAGLTVSEDLATLTPNDVVLAVGFRRRPPFLRRTLEACRQIGTKIVYLTDPTARNTAKLSDIVLRCHAIGASVFDSYVAPMSVLNYLCAAVALRQHDESQERLARIESFHEMMDDLESRSARQRIRPADAQRSPTSSRKRRKKTGAE